MQNAAHCKPLNVPKKKQQAVIQCLKCSVTVNSYLHVMFYLALNVDYMNGFYQGSGDKKKNTFRCYLSPLLLANVSYSVPVGNPAPFLQVITWNLNLSAHTTFQSLKKS